MTNPILVENCRAGIVESMHRGAVAVVDYQGKVVFSAGDIERPIYPRSAVKILQALPLVESGAATRYGLSPSELALTCASHIGEPEHAVTALSMLLKAGQDVGCLECGVHWPTREQAGRELFMRGEKPSALHNNCSGKHAGFICVACDAGIDPKGYVTPDHQVQQNIRHVMQDLMETPVARAECGTDGCSIPTYASPLRALALAFAKLGAGQGKGMEATRGQAARTLREAVVAAPTMVAGKGRFDTIIPQVLGTRAYVKLGAEGVYCASFPELGYGVALKIDDGLIKAGEIAMASLIAKFLTLSDAEAGVVAQHAAPVLKNWNGMEVGNWRVGAGMR